MQLSQPVPEAAFAAKWGQPDSVKHLAYWHRHEAMRLTAKSGVLANLRLLAVGPGGPHEVGAAGCGLTVEVHAAAVEAGQLQMCMLLEELGCPWFEEPMVAATVRGHTSIGLRYVNVWTPKRIMIDTVSAAAGAARTQLCQTLAAKRCNLSEESAGSAAFGGHVEAVRALIALSNKGRHRPLDSGSLLDGAAFGVDLANQGKEPVGLSGTASLAAHL